MPYQTYSSAVGYTILDVYVTENQQLRVSLIVADANIGPLEIDISKLGHYWYLFYPIPPISKNKIKTSLLVKNVENPRKVIKKIHVTTHLLTLRISNSLVIQWLTTTQLSPRGKLFKPSNKITDVDSFLVFQRQNTAM